MKTHLLQIGTLQIGIRYIAPLTPAQERALLNELQHKVWLRELKIYLQSKEPTKDTCQKLSELEELENIIIP